MKISWNKKLKGEHTRGFTLIEALVAITVMLLSIGGPMAIAQSGIQNTVFARDQIVAFYIAQEGIELIRSVRDDNALQGDSWLNDIAASCMSTLPVDPSEKGCGIDIDNMNFIDCAGNAGAACNIYYRSSGLSSGGTRGIYGHDSGGQPTIYKRSLKVVTINANEVSIDATVEWLSRGTTKTITVQSRMFDQYNNI
jgi:type II secretory pathway pseudopilin PulG